MLLKNDRELSPIKNIIEWQIIVIWQYNCSKRIQTSQKEVFSGQSPLEEKNGKTEHAVLCPHMRLTKGETECKDSLMTIPLGREKLTRHARVVNWVSHTSTVDLGSTWAYAELSPVKFLLINEMSSSPIYSVVLDIKFCVILPNTCQYNSYFRITMPRPETKSCPAAYTYCYSFIFWH